MITKEEKKDLMIQAFEIAVKTEREDDHGRSFTHTPKSLVEAADLIFKKLTEK